MRTAIFVVGMHRSGTSALARTLNLMGACLPRNLFPPGVGNELGHWEPEASVRLHDRLLEAAGTSVNDLSGPPERWFETEAAEAFLNEMRELIVSEFAEDPLLVFKDPRSALVFPMWRRVLSELDIRCLPVIISRNPVEVAKSLEERRIKVMSEQSWPLDRGGLLWLRYALAAERYTRGTTRAFCLYADLLRDWRKVVQRLAADLALSWPRSPEEAEADIQDFLSAEMRHHDESDEVLTTPGIWSSWIAPAYETLCHASTGAEPDRTKLDVIGKEFDNACGGVRPAAVRNDPRAPLRRWPAAVWPRSHGVVGKNLCLVVTVPLPDAHAAQLAPLAEAAQACGFNLTIVLAGAPTSSAEAVLDALASEHGCHVEVCAPVVPATEPAYMRATIEIFRYLRARHFDAILFEDRDGIGYASVTAKQAGLAFEETVLAVLAFGSSRYWRERKGQFPGTAVAIATEYLEQQALERADIAVLVSLQNADWMCERGWRFGKALPLHAEPAGSPVSGGADWGSILAQLRTAERVEPASGTCADDVTIVIPYFEQPRLLEQNLQALTRQTSRDFTVIIVDDGSRSTESSNFLEGVEDQYPELTIRVLRQENRYVGAARNAGIRAASTDLIILLDDDNIAYPNMVQVLRRAIHLTKADVVTCGITPFYDAIGTPPVGLEHKGPDHFYSGGPVLLGAMDNCFGDVSGIYRKSIFDQVGYFHELLGVTFEDWQMHLRTVAAGFTLVSLPEPLVWYRVRSDSMLRTTRRYDNARVIASAINEMLCSALEPLSDYLMGSEAEQVRLHDEIERVTARAYADVQATHAVAAVNSIALLEARTEADRYARSLEEAVEERTKNGIEAEQYARSLEEAVSELRKSLDAATAYAVSLEQSRLPLNASSASSVVAGGVVKHALFIHIPKTGGSSIAAMIERQDGPVSPGEAARFVESTDWDSVQQYKYFFAHAPLFVRDVLPHPIVTFTVLRDPVDRVISTYNHLLRVPSAPGADVLIGDKVSCVEALTHPALSTHFVDVATRMLGAHLDLTIAQPDGPAMQFASVTAFETEADEFTYRRALYGLGTLQFVGFTERLREDARALAELLGLEDGDVPFENQSPEAFDWPIPKAVRTPELEQAVQRHSFFDCCLDRAARDFFLREDAGARVTAREHFARLARSDQSVVFAGVPQFAELPGPRKARRRRTLANSRLMAAERLAGHLDQELRRTHERAAAEISVREAAFKDVERYAKTLEAELERLRNP